jgi:hypothetical protein
MADVPSLVVRRDGHVARFHGSWYRGPHTNFIPSKAQLRDPDAVDRYILHGWMPEAPFIDKARKITAFGSCFAQHLTQYLHSAGYNILGKHLDLHSHIIRFGEGMVNTFAVRQQLEWALEDKEFSENLWFGADKEIASLDPAIRVETKQIIGTTEIFVITLGLSEIWYDKKTGEAFWRAIPLNMFDPSRHGFRVSSPEENHANLVRIRDLIRTARPEAKIIFTLSPVPLMATFRPISCLTASSVSKAILRVAIDELMRDCSGDANMFYFPSYEIVREFFVDPYRDDNRHPKPEVIDFIMRTFERHFCMPTRASESNQGAGGIASSR